MELELERELIAFIEMRFDFQVASLCLCLSYEMLFILLSVFCLLAWVQVEEKLQEEICIVIKLPFAAFHMKCISIDVC